VAGGYLSGRFITFEGETIMDYKTMYFNLFHAVTDVIIILQAAQIATEDLFIEHEPADIALLRPDADEGKG
jgi:hypothetical protein